MLQKRIMNLTMINMPNKETIKRYVWSSLITFLAAFAFVFLQEIDNLTLDSIKDGALTGIVFLGIRVGVKAVIEWFLSNVNIKNAYHVLSDEN